MTLEEAIEEAKSRVGRGYSQYDLHDFEETIINAVASGQLVPKADADLAVAEAQRDVIDMMWQRRRADERAEAAEAEVTRLTEALIAEEGPDLGASTREPSLRTILYHYYLPWMMATDARSFADRYIAALTPKGDTP